MQAQTGISNGESLASDGLGNTIEKLLCKCFFRMSGLCKGAKFFILEIKFEPLVRRKA